MLAPQGEDFFEYRQKVHQADLFRLARVTTEKQVCRIRKKTEKYTFEISICVKKLQNHKKLRSFAAGSDIFLGTKRDA